MTSTTNSTQQRIEDLQRFHREHFLGQSIPDVRASAITDLDQNDKLHREETDTLGYYSDGVKRTLTDEQIAIFRNSEIQRRLAERRRAREQELEVQQEQEEEDDRAELQESLPGLRENNTKAYRRGKFEDDSVTDHVSLLVYDDSPNQNTPTSNGFIWPKLG